MKRIFGNILAFLLLLSFSTLFCAGILLDAREVDSAIIELKKDWGLP